MAALTWTYDGLGVAIEAFCNNSSVTDLRCHLYVNNVNVLITSVFGDLTPCTLPTYAFVTTAAGSWVFSDAGPLALADYPSFTYTFGAVAVGAVQTIYGFAITNTANVLLAGGKLDTAFPVPPAGGSLTVSMELQTLQG